MRKRWAGWTIVFICWNLAGLLMDRAWVLSPSVWAPLCVLIASALFTAGCEMLLSVVREEINRSKPASVEYVSTVERSTVEQWWGK